METKILFQQDKHIVGISEEGEYFEAYSTLYRKNILGGAGLYIQELRNKNRKLKISALKYEINVHLDRILEILQKLGFVSKSEFFTDSVAYNWISDEPSEKDMDKVLNELGY